MNRLIIAALAALLFACPTARADYPDRPVRIIVPFQAGGAGDAAARLLAEHLSEKLGQPFVVDNKPGANGLIGTGLASNSAPDGLTLFLGHTDTQVLNPKIYKKLPYDPSKPMEPVAFIGRVPGVLLARSGLGVKNGQELIRLAKSNPGKITIGSWGIGSTAHLGMLMMQKAAGVEFTHVPYQGAPAAIAQLLGGQLDLAFATPAFARSVSANGTSVALGTSSARRLQQAPEFAPLAEQGFPGLDLDTWYGLMAPAGTPVEIRQVLNREVNAALKRNEVLDKLQRSGFEVSPMAVSEFSAFIAEEDARWGRLIREKSISVD